MENSLGKEFATGLRNPYCGHLRPQSSHPQRGVVPCNTTRIARTSPAVAAAVATAAAATSPAAEAVRAAVEAASSPAAAGAVPVAAVAVPTVPGGGGDR
jgi:hypothetical protein